MVSAIAVDTWDTPGLIAQIVERKVLSVLSGSALLEGFVSPSDLPQTVRLLIGPLAGVALYVLLFSVGRRRDENRAETVG